MNLCLQQIYYSEKCSWFYIGLLILSFGLVMVTIFDGFTVADSPLFIVLEFILNLLIGIDFICRIKLVGCQKYVRDPTSNKIRWWNIFDALVVTFCNAVFALSLFSKEKGSGSVAFLGCGGSSTGTPRWGAGRARTTGSGSGATSA